uniref:1-phosphatidylinositol-3-phosphate 5-kinase n=1 Tax=Kwoniella bestiolae CBS 10118 TaxID=1296100 RepID=A0A1B9G0Q4_9TREE|nr:1-phosphatidylinositol-3-phosphate 5-kinase [Kwoniella bestiolae CBS 10118]OCF24599.1 1-phosphatidylinositol-3-phosphate 5-kinase [Kwoniella bestiolae CBS 10118]
MSSSLQIETANLTVPSSTKPSPSVGLTTFPNPFEDEPEQGILPTLLSKVKQTFTSSSSTPTPGGGSSAAGTGKDKGSPVESTSQSDGKVGGKDEIRPKPHQTEAQAIAEAVRKGAQQAALAASSRIQDQNQNGTSTQSGNGRRQSSGPSTSTTSIQPMTSNTPSVEISRPVVIQATSPRKLPSKSLRPPLSTVNSVGSTTSSVQAPSILSSSHSQAPTNRRIQAPNERQWRPSLAAPAQVTISPVTSVTTTVQASTSTSTPGSNTKRPQTPDASTPFPSGPGYINRHRSHHHNHNPSLGGPSSRSATPLHHHVHVNSLSNPVQRVRRSSIATLPDSPSSISISTMLAANAELSTNFNYVPGFPLNQDDTRSIRSLGGFVKKQNSVSKIIRRIRGEGLSKHYWMSDEACKECYDCKSVFTAWRRKHHCRICGQIFCSRCASNIIGARRFGQEGAVRVCNLCLKIMEEYRDDDEDDRRSINSVSTSVHRFPSISDRAFLDAAISPEVPYAKSPFAASQLFTSHPNDSLTAIDETSVPTRWGGEQDLDRPYTPVEMGGGSQLSDSEDAHIWTTSRPQTAAPFRRPMEDEQKSDHVPDDDLQNEQETSQPQSGPSSPEAIPSGTQSRAEPFPRTDTMSTDGALENRVPLTRMDSNMPLIGLRTRLSSRASQGGLTALLDSEKSEGLWRARSHSFAQRPELLSGASLNHFHLMLQQAIARADLPHPQQWHRTLSNLLLKVSTNLQPNVKAGDDIDVRAYVKIKKVPGGKISDSEYVDGIVISKNVAHKAMPRRLVNPRIMVVTFPLDYHRVENQFMSLDPILAQEKDYLRLLTKRIIDVRPHIVLVQPSASRIALEYLLEANIAVARSVKVSAIHQVARCTQADVVASMDRLALEPRLGRCAEFRIQSFEHELIPGRRKTLMRFEGGHRDYGCTIILRGGDLETLRKVKVVTDFMALVVYHLKNEIILYNDEHNIFPPHAPLSTEYQELLEVLNEEGPVSHGKSESTATIIQITDVDENGEPVTPKPAETDDDEDEKQVERREALQTTRQIAQSLQPYLMTVLSASAAIRFPPPATLAKMAELDRALANLRQSIDDEEAAQILQEETKVVESTKSPEPITESGSSSTSLSTSMVDTAESTTTEVSSSAAMSAIPVTTAPMKEATRDPYRVLRKPEEVARESALAQIEHHHFEQLKLWQWYTRRFTDPLRAEDYQGIVYLYSLGCEGTDKPCVEPLLQTINFYQAGDRTLGQFLEELALNAAQRCTSKTCERLLLFHFHLLVHGERRLQIAMDQFPCPSPGHEDQIITWSYCRLCATPSPTTILREETWKMSWGAYLEHCFYPPETRAGFTCPHDAFRDQIRYFAHRNLAIRIHNEPVDIYEPLRPSITLQVKAETKVVLKNQEYESALHKNTAFFDSVLFRLRSFDTDICPPEKIGSLKIALENMLSRAVADREEMVNLLNRTYKLTPMTDVLALNMVLRTLQDKVVQWDSDFAEIEKSFMPSEKDLRRMTATHLKRLFANQDVFNSLDRNVASLTVSEADEKEGKEDISSESTPAPSEPATPGLESTDAGNASGISAAPSVLDLNSDNNTPMAGVIREEPNPLSQPPTPGGEREYDSDSTISAIRRDSPGRSPLRLAESSGLDSDTHQFVSRLPRRSRPAPSIADLVQRFNDATTLQPYENVEEPERPGSSSSIRRKARRSPHPEISDSDHSPKTRPRMRRGRTEQPPVRYREVGGKPGGLLSDGDRSYATNASRIPSTYSRNKSLAGPSSDHLRPGLRSRTPSYTGRISPRSPRSARVSPERPPRSSIEPSSSGQQPVTTQPESKPRMTGKGKSPRPPEPSSGRTSPSLIRTAARRTLASSSRVTSIARHFDRLSREAERERQKRISMVRGKRARPVGVTKAKVQVFDNLRDAFRDEFDTDSSEADNEEDELGSDDDAESGGEVDEDGQPKQRRKSSPTKTRSRKNSPIKATTPLEPIPVKPSPSTESIPQEDAKTDEIPISASGASLATQSILSDTRSEMSFTDRLQIELPSFETSAPLPSHPVTPQLSIDTADELPKGPQHPTMSQMSQMSESELSSGGVERSSILKTLTGLWAFRAGDFTPLEYPLSASEHLFADSRVIIRENEPTSIIAFTLSSKTYRDKMRAEANQSKTGGGNGKTEAFMPDEHHHGNDRASTWDIVSMDEAMDNDGDLRREGGTHLKYDFESGASTIFCRIFFAEQFAALRSACQCEDSFVESLARCVQFDASGGKSGSAFLKTKDDRFIAKEISRLEMDALTKFAPAYFEYTRKAFQGQRPTVLAKIYGFFKIGYRNAITGRYMRMNVLVMENLFYERRFSKIYDLKGSTRNRLIQATGRVNEVLLDENLMEIVYKHPLYLRDHSKRILRTALFNDTLFLSNLNVMDYSLVVGVDSERHELVVGIVDYIRTFTWDKKLESWVKDSAFLGGAGKGEPTIVTPKQYKIRFRTAMERFYFPSVPDRWTKVGMEEIPIEEDGQSIINNNN